MAHGMTKTDLALADMVSRHRGVAKKIVRARAIIDTAMRCLIARQRDNLLTQAYVLRPAQVAAWAGMPVCGYSYDPVSEGTARRAMKTALQKYRQHEGVWVRANAQCAIVMTHHELMQARQRIAYAQRRTWLIEQFAALGIQISDARHADLVISLDDCERIVQVMWDDWALSRVVQRLGLNPPSRN